MPSIRDVPERTIAEGVPLPSLRNSGSHPIAIADDSDDPETGPSAVEIVAALSSAGTTAVERRQSILLAESTSFDGTQTAIVRPSLKHYVERHYSTDERDEFVAVASAVRQSVASLSAAELPQVVAWLEANRKSPPAFEMEVVKSIRRKLAETVPGYSDGMEPLADVLIDIFEGYSTPRMLPKRYCGATALDAALSVSLLGGPQFPRLLECLRRSRVGWFRSVVARQAEALWIEVVRDHPEGIAVADRLVEAATACKFFSETAE